MKFESPFLIGIATGVSLVALTACAGTREPAAVTSQAAGQPSPSVNAEAVASVEVNLTAPGTELPVSEDLTVTVRESWWDSHADASGIRDVPATYSFDGIREGSAGDLTEALGADDLATIENHSLYYVDYTITLVDGPLENPASIVNDVTKLDAIDTAGGPDLGDFVLFDGGPDVCAYPDKVALANNGSTPACQIVMVQPGESIDRLQFPGADPVTWLVD